MKTLSKPAGIPVFPPHADPSGDCVLARLLSEDPWRKEIAFPENFAGGIAHRLDTSTSGALAVADDLAELERMRAAFSEKRLVKTYVFRAARVVAWDDNTCVAAMAHHPSKRDRMVVQRGRDTDHRGRWLEAQTWFLRLGPDLWQARMRTGVMHQVRAHAAFVGLPLTGDRLYGGGPTPVDAPAGAAFLLHHVGIEGDGWRTEPVAAPEWAESRK